MTEQKNIVEKMSKLYSKWKWKKKTEDTWEFTTYATPRRKIKKLDN